MVTQVGLMAIFLVAAVAIMVRPFGVGEGWVATGAAAIALGTGLLPLAAAGRGLLLTLDVLAFFGGLLLLAAAGAAAGVFDLLLHFLVAWSGGSPRRLLVGTAVAGALVTAVLSNDACVLLFAPAVLRLIRRLHLPATPYLLAIAFIANSASLVLPMGNPVNLLILDRARLQPLVYVATVTPAATVGTAILVLALAVASRRIRAARFPVPDVPGPPDPILARAMLVVIVALVGADAGAVVLQWPLGVPTLAIGAAAAGILWARRPDALHLLRGGGAWGLLPLVLGLSVLGSGLGGLRLLAEAAASVAPHGTGPGAGLAVGTVTAVLSATLNNLPAALLVSSGLGAVHHLGGLALTVIAGADVGPNLAPMGSLSTLLLFAVARRAGVRPGWGGFWRQAVWAGPLSLVPVLVLVAVR